MDLTNTFEAARLATRELNLASTDKINSVLNELANETVKQTEFILAENKKDLDLMDKSNPVYDRLMLTETRIQDIAKGIRDIASFEFKLHETLETKDFGNGMVINRITVPLGVVAVIYEARPNVTLDVFALCFKSSNVCILKGGTDAYNSNAAIVSIIHNVLKKHGFTENVATLLPAGREAAEELLNAVGYVDVLIPRGSAGLISHVRDNARVPVIETGAGVCHTYFDIDGDTEIGAKVICNAKTRRVSVCNALDCLLINEKRLSELPEICNGMAEKNVVIYADEKAFNALNGKYPQNLLEKATEKSFGTEFMDYKMAIKTVSDVNEAINHIDKYGSKHSEAIISKNAETIATFQMQVDASCVYANASTAFTDGGQFGLGGEIGISTQKLHARGPMALKALTTYKWIINGNGNTRK